MNKNKKLLLAGFRIFFALLGFSAVVTEIATLSERGKFIFENFFSFFTIQSNLFAVVTLLISALALAKDKPNDRISLLRGSSTLNMILVGIIFSLLLAGLDVDLTAVPWDNTVLHYIMPAFVALDWLIDLPKIHISFKRALVWMVFPFAYIAYTLIRGYFVGWYPYPFLNPVNNGYVGVGIVSGVMALGTIALIWLLAKLTGPESFKKT